MYLKICANTDSADALEAVRLGADALGFVFAPSPRRVTPEQVAAIAAALPAHVERVGIFAADPVDEIADAVIRARLTTVQLHGGLDLAFADRLAARVGPGIGLIHTLHWRIDDDKESAQRVRDGLAALAAYDAKARVLVDAKVGSVSGGTGKTFNWDQSKLVLASQPGLRVIVAGGLRPENVAEAVRTLAPWGVDVASGVESEPGRKDFAKLRRFIENARGAA